MSGTVPAPASPPDLADDGFGRRLAELTPALRTFVRRLCLAEDEDLVQETLTRAWRSRGTHDPGRGTLLTWLHSIAFRARLDELARGGRRPGALADPDLRQGTIPGPPHVVAERELLQASLARLSPVERTVLLLFHAHGHDVAGIARTLGMPDGTVKSHLHRARRKLAAAEGESAP